MKEKLISVLIPTYNVGKYVKEAVESILNQTYSNLELIIVDDASTDNTFDILKELAEYDKRIKLFRNSKNSKIVETLNFALTKATGTYIARMDGDDISLPTRIMQQYLFLIENPCIDLVGCQPISIDEKGNELSYHELIVDEKKIYKVLSCTSPVLHIWLTKKSVYEKLNGYRLSPTEDYDFLLRMKTEGLRFTNLDEFLYKVRIRQGNTLTTQGLKQRKAFNYARRLYKQRLLNGFDNYSFEEYTKKTKVSRLGHNLFGISVKLLNKAVIYRKKNIMLSYILALFSSLFSIYQIQYLYLLVRLNRLKNE